MKIIKIVTYDDNVEEVLTKIKKLEAKGEIDISESYISDEVY